MIEIGSSRTVVIRVRKATENGKRKLIPKRDEQGQIVTRIVPHEVTRVTKESLDGSFGPDRGRKIVVSLKAGDILTLRPYRAWRAVSAPLDEVYRWMVQRKANSEYLAKARITKSKKAALRLKRKLAADERRLLRPC